MQGELTIQRLLAKMQEVEKHFGCPLIELWGMTELAGLGTTFPSNGPHKLGSIGIALPHVEARISATDGSDRVLAKGEIGELQIRGPITMQGYLNRPDATAAMIDAEGWLHTGDVGYADAEGCFFIVDRVKELIKYKGLQIAPAELEAVLLSHPGVADAAVIPVADDECGEVPKAFVVLRGETKPEEVMGFVAERVAPYKKLRAMEVTDQIPKSPSGKILRRLLVQREREKAARA